MAPGVRVYTVKGQFDNSEILQRFIEIQSAKERAFGSIKLQFDDASLRPLLTDIANVRGDFATLSNVDLTKPVDELRNELRSLNNDIQSVESELLNMQFKGGGASRHTQEFTNTLNEYFDKIEKEFGRELANIARARGTIGSVGELRKEFVSDTKPPDEFNVNAVKQVEEKQKFTNAERQRMIELESQVYEKRLQAIQVEQALLEKEYAEIVSATGAVESAAAQAGADELLNSAWQEFQQQSERLINEELDLSRTLADRKRRLAEMLQAEEARANQQIGSSASNSGTTPRATAITVSEKSAANAERLAKALEDAAAAEAKLAETTAKFNQANSGNTLETERRRLEMQRQNAVIQESLVEQERTSGAERRAQLQSQAAAEAAAQQQIIQAARAAASEKAAVARAEANERSEVARQGTLATAEAERRSTVQFIEEERRKTAALRGELRERASAEKQNKASISAFTDRASGVLDFATGGFAAYGAAQAIQQTVDAAKEGAGQLRFAQVFEQQAQRVGVSAQQMLRAIQEASNGTVRESQAMALGAQLLSQKFAESTDDVVGDTQKLIEFSRRASQLYTDESGQLLSTQDVFARLLKFVREGNKELVDQFGISNQAIADFLNIPVSGLAGSNGAADRFKGLVGILAQETERLGKAGETAADQMERSEARISAAQDRIRQSLAEPVADIMDGIAAGINNATTGLGMGTLSSDITLVAERVDYLQEKLNQLKGGQGFFLQDIFGGDTGRNGSIAGIEEELKSVETLRNLLSQIGSNPALDEFKDRLQAAAIELANTGGISQATAASLEIINNISESYAKAIAIVGAETLKTNSEAQALTTQLEELDALLRNGSISGVEYYKSLDAIEGKLRDIKVTADSLAERQQPGGGYLSFFNPEELATLDEQFAEAEKKVKEGIQNTRDDLLQAAQQQADAIIEGGGSYDEALVFLQGKEAEIAKFFADLPKNISPQELNLQATQFKINNIEIDKSPIDKAQGDLSKDVQDSIEKLVGQGLDPQQAISLIQEYGKKIADEFAKIPDGIGASELGVRVAQINANVETELSALGDTLNLSDINPQDAISTIVGALDDLDSAAGDGIPGFSTIKSDLSGLLADIMETGTVTKDQAQALSEYTALANAAGSETGFYAQAIQGLGFEFFNNDQQASSLISRMVELDAAHANGAISSGNYAGQLSVLLKALYDVALQAGVSKDVLDGMFGSANAFIQSNTGAADFQAGAGQGEVVSQLEAIFAAQRRRAQEQAEIERATAKAQQEAARALKEAAAQQKSDVSSTPGLFGVSAVTPEQMAAAEAGIPQQFADDFLRQLADLIQNGVKRPGVTIDRAKEALGNVGVETAGLNDRAIFELLKQKWSDSSLFANPENLGLINFDAVKQQLALKEKAREGVDNIYEQVSAQFGIAFDTVTSALGGTRPTTTPTPTATPVATPNVAPVQVPATVTATIDPTALTTALQQITDQQKQSVLTQVELQTAPGATETFLASLDASLSAVANVALRTQPGETDTFIAALESSLFATATIDLRTEPNQVATFLKSLESSLAVTAQVTLAQVDALPQPLPPASQAILGPQPADPTKPKEQSYLPDFNVTAVSDQLAGAVSSPEITALFSRAAESGAAAFANGFSTYDFGGLLAIPIAAMEAAMLDGKTAERLDALGAAAAITLKGGFARQTAADDWMGDVVASIEARVTNNVLSTLAN